MLEMFGCDTTVRCSMESQMIMHALNSCPVFSRTKVFAAILASLPVQDTFVVHGFQPQHNTCCVELGLLLCEACLPGLVHQAEGQPVQATVATFRPRPCHHLQGNIAQQAMSNTRGITGVEMWYNSRVPCAWLHNHLNWVHAWGKITCRSFSILPYGQ